MSNYINVLRRLERERRTPDQAPMAAPMRPMETAGQAAAAPATLPTAPPAYDGPPPPSVPRTVIPLPSATTPAAPPPAPIAIAPGAAPAPAPAPPAPVFRIDPPAIAPAPPLAAPDADTRRSRAFTVDHPGIATLLDNIRMLSGQRAGRIVVLCGASSAEPVAALAAQLVAHAEQRGMRAIVATLLRTATGTIVTPGHGARDESTSLRVDLDASPSPDELHAWGQRLAPGNDLVVLTGPPLAGSIDAALLACACDGLVIVAESEVTDRAALHTAAERARIAGCRTLGVVMHGTKDRMPGWIRRIMGDRSETHSRED